MYANAAYAMARSYALGDGVEANHSKAAKCYRAAAENGHTEAQFELAKKYDEGCGIDCDSTVSAYS